MTTRGDWKVSEESLEHKELYKCIHVKEYTKLYDNIYDIHDCMNENELNSLLIKVFLLDLNDLNIYPFTLFVK